MCPTLPYWRFVPQTRVSPCWSAASDNRQSPRSTPCSDLLPAHKFARPCPDSLYHRHTMNAPLRLRGFAVLLFSGNRQGLVVPLLFGFVGGWSATRTQPDSDIPGLVMICRLVESNPFAPE